MELRALAGPQDVRTLAIEEKLRRDLGGVTDFAGVVKSGALNRPALRRLWRCIKKQTARGENTDINVAGSHRLKPAQTDLLFRITVHRDGMQMLSTGAALHARGHISAPALEALNPTDRYTTQRWVWDAVEPLDPEGPHGSKATVLRRPRVAPTTVAFYGLLVTRHVTNVRLDKTTQYCDACLRAAPHLYTCTQCQVGTFCSETCQRAAWPAHKAWCRAAAALPDRGQDSHAIVPAGKFELDYALVQMDRGGGRAAAPRASGGTCSATPRGRRSATDRRWGAAPMTPRQMERLRRFLAATGGVPPDNA